MKIENRQWLLEQVDEAKNSGACVREICKTIGKSSRTLKRWRKNLQDDGRKSNRFQRNNALTREEEKEAIDILCSPRFRDMTPNVIVAILAEEGKYIASERTMYRILAKKNLNRFRTDTRAPRRERPEELIAHGPDQVWSWDITYIPSYVRGQFYYQYMIIDIWDRSIVGCNVYKEQSGENAAELLRETCIKKGIDPGSVALHQDNGGPMISADFLGCAKRFDIHLSYSRPSKCNDNPYSESLFRTEKYRPGYPLRFASLEELIEWSNHFVEWYNNEHRHSGIGYVTPMQRRNGEDIAILEKRRETYEKARSEHPERWSRKTRKWERDETVTLNPKNRRKRKPNNAA